MKQVFVYILSYGMREVYVNEDTNYEEHNNVFQPRFSCEYERVKEESLEDV